MEKIKNYFKTAFDVLVVLYHSIWFKIFLVFIGVVIGAIAQFNTDKHDIQANVKQTKITYVREFVEHPEHYKLDTLYRKSKDTLFIDTIKIDYIAK